MWSGPALWIAGLLLLAACAPAAPPAPTKPAAVPTTAAEPAKAATEPAKAAAELAKPAAEPAKPAAKPAAASSGTAPVLNLGLVNNLQYIPWFIGVEKGIFLKHGVDVKIRIFNTGTDVVKAVQAGEVQTGVAAFTTLINTFEQGIKFKSFMLAVNDALDPAPDALLAIFAQPTAGISKIEDLRGKKIGAATGNSPDVYVRAALQKAKVPLDAVEFVNVVPSNIIAAYESGLDVVVTTEPYGEMLAAKHPQAKLIARGGGLFAQRIVVYGTEAWLAANRDLAEKLVGGFVEASYLSRTQPDLVAEVVPRWLSGLDGNLAVKAARHIPFDPRISRVVQESWDTDVKVQLEQKRVKQAVPFSQAFDTSFSEAIPQKYPDFLKDLKPLP